jgi:subtilase family serine protease
MHTTLRRLLVLSLLCALIAACSSTTGETGGSTTTSTTGHPTPAGASTLAPYPTDTSTHDACPASLSFAVSCQTPQSMRIAYGIEPLIQKGYTGQGQAIVDIVSFGSPTLQQDINVFDRQFGLPPITIPQISPIHEPVYDPHNDRAGWGDETTLDVEIMHALAPGAKIVVLVSPVAETEGTIGLPEFRQLLQYTIDHKLGNIVSNSWGASEMTLKDAKGRAEIEKWDALFKQATTQDGITLLASSGDNGATDYADVQESKLSTTPTTSFPNDDPWVVSVGGTSLRRDGRSFDEVAWNSGIGSASGGGFSQFYAEPSYQKTLPASVQSLAKGRRGVPDVAGNADPNTGLAMYEAGSWSMAGGTSASTPMWAALVAIANQMAGHPLGFINPALYTIASSAHYSRDFHDITVGNNTVTTQGVQVQGYSAGPGWDPVTGLGTPNAVTLLPDLIAAANSSSSG